MRIKIHAIEKATLPPLDDAFAQQLGVPTVEELNTRIEELLNKKADEAVREQQREQVTAFLLSHPFEIPHSVIQKEIRFRMEQMIKDVDFKRQWDMSSDKNKHEMVEQIQTQAEKRSASSTSAAQSHRCKTSRLARKILRQLASSPIEALLYPTTPTHDPSQPILNRQRPTPVFCSKRQKTGSLLMPESNHLRLRNKPHLGNMAKNQLCEVS